jgi:uncharacterized protein (DUF4415 family)
MSRKHKRQATKLRARDLTAAEFDRLFDNGGDEIDRMVDWSKAEVRMPSPKQAISLRLDSDLLDWFKSFGKGYQTRINAVLRSYKDACAKARG